MAGTDAVVATQRPKDLRGQVRRLMKEARRSADRRYAMTALSVASTATAVETFRVVSERFLAAIWALKDKGFLTEAEIEAARVEMRSAFEAAQQTTPALAGPAEPFATLMHETARVLPQSGRRRGRAPAKEGRHG